MNEQHTLCPCAFGVAIFLRCGVTFTITLAGLWKGASFAQKNAMGWCGISRGETRGAQRVGKSRSFPCRRRSRLERPHECGALRRDRHNAAPLAFTLTRKSSVSERARYLPEAETHCPHAFGTGTSSRQANAAHKVFKPGVRAERIESRAQ